MKRLLHYFTFTAALFAALVVHAWTGAGALFAQCHPDNAPFVYLHPFFNDSLWESTTSAEVPQELCGASPASVAFSSDPAIASGVVAAANGTLELVTSSVDLTAGLCGPRTLILDPPRTLSFSSPAGSPVAVLTSMSEDTVYTATTDGTLVLMYHVNVINLAVGAVDTLRPALNGGAQILLLSGNNAATGLWIAGSQGLVRQYVFSADQWQAEHNYDLAQTETVTALGGGYCATAALRVFKFSGPGFSPFSNIPQPARYLNVRGGAGDNGMVFRFTGDGLVTLYAGSSNLRAVHILPAGPNAAVKALLVDWNTVSIGAPGLPTYVRTVEPGELTDAVNAATPISSSLYNEITLVLEDPDGALSVPSLDISQQGTGPFIAAQRIEPSDELLDMQPDLSCNMGTFQLSSDSLLFTFSSAAITLTTLARSGSYFVPCGSCVWLEQDYSCDWAWSPEDVCRIAVGADTLLVVNEGGSVTTVESPPASSLSAHLSIWSTGNTVTITVDKNRSVVAASLYTLAGRRIAAIVTSPAPSGLVCQLQAPAPSCLIARVTLGDGSHHNVRVLNRN